MSPNVQGDVETPLLLSNSAEVEPEHASRRAARAAYTAICHFGASLLFGLVTAVCMKAFGHVIAMALILLFIGFLVLAYYGYVNLNWSSLRNVVGQSINIRSLDGNSVGLKEVSEAFTNIFTWTISWGLMSVAGFGTGFYIGCWEL